MSEPALSETVPARPRSAGDGAAVLALVLSFVAAAFLLFISPLRGCSFDGTTETCAIRWDIVLRALAVGAPGLLVSAIPVVALRSRRAALLRTSTAIILGILAVSGLLLPPAFLLLPSAVAMSFSALQARRVVLTSGQPGRVLAWISLALTVGAGLAVLSTLEAQDTDAVGFLLVPVVLALVPAAAGRHRSARTLRVLSAVILTILTLLSMLSIGIFYVPAVLAMVAAASIDSPEQLGAEPVAQ